MRLALACLLVLCAAPVFAQAPQVIANQPFRIAADHDGVDTDGYRLYVDGAQVGSDIPVSARVNGTLVVDVPGLARGSHTLALGAFNEGGEGRSQPFTFEAVRRAPTAPTGLRLAITVALQRDGTYTVLVAEAK